MVECPKRMSSSMPHAVSELLPSGQTPTHTTTTTTTITTTAPTSPPPMLNMVFGSYSCHKNLARHIDVTVLSVFFFEGSGPRPYP